MNQPPHTLYHVFLWYGCDCINLTGRDKRNCNGNKPSNNIYVRRDDKKNMIQITEQVVTSMKRDDNKKDAKNGVMTIPQKREVPLCP